MSRSWVTISTVFPARVRPRSRASTVSVVAESRLPVGSSATTSAGSLASARAMAARCCCPPESMEGSLFA